MYSLLVDIPLRTFMLVIHIFRNCVTPAKSDSFAQFPYYTLDTIPICNPVRYSVSISHVEISLCFLWTAQREHKRAFIRIILNYLFSSDAFLLVCLGIRRRVFSSPTIIVFRDRFYYEANSGFDSLVVVVVVSMFLSFFPFFPPPFTYAISHMFSR